MSIVEIRATPSHRYFMRKSKADILLRIVEMRRALGKSDLTNSEMDDLKKRTAYSLAGEAMKLIREFPE